MGEGTKKSKDKDSIWKLEHTPLNERKTSSGLTFRTAKEKDGEEDESWA